MSRDKVLAPSVRAFELHYNVAQGIIWPDSKCEFAFPVLRELLSPSWGPTLPKALPPNANIGITFPVYGLGRTIQLPHP